MGLARYAARQVIHQTHHKPPARPQSRQQVAQPDAKAEAAKRVAHAARVERDLKALRAQLVKDQIVPATVKPAEDTTPAIPVNPNRPRSLDDVVGQQFAVQQLRLVVMSSMLRNAPVPHVLIEGGSGMGKSSLAGVVADTIGAEMVTANGTSLRSPKDLVGLVLKMDGPTVFYLDEGHACSKSVQEALYGMMEDHRLDVLSGQGNDAAMSTHPVDHVTVVVATNRAGLLSSPFLNRFGLRLTMDPYSDEELATIVAKSWDRQDIAYDADETLSVAYAAKGTPRRALHLADRVRDWITVAGHEKVGPGAVVNALATFGVSPDGMEDLDRRILVALTSAFSGRSIGLDSLASFLDVDAKSISDMSEGWLCREGYVAKTKGGRMATTKAYEWSRGE